MDTQIWLNVKYIIYVMLMGSINNFFVCVFSEEARLVSFSLQHEVRVSDLEDGPEKTILKHTKDQLSTERMKYVLLEGLYQDRTEKLTSEVRAWTGLAKVNQSAGMVRKNLLKGNFLLKNIIYSMEL